VPSAVCVRGQSPDGPLTETCTFTECWRSLRPRLADNKPLICTADPVVNVWSVASVMDVAGGNGSGTPFPVTAESWANRSVTPYRHGAVEEILPGRKDHVRMRRWPRYQNQWEFGKFPSAKKRPEPVMN